MNVYLFLLCCCCSTLICNSRFSSTHILPRRRTTTSYRSKQASRQASRQRGLSTQWEFISKVPDSRLKLMSSCEGKRRRCFAIAALLNWKSNQRLLFYLNMKLNSFKSVVTLHTATTKKWEPSHSLPTFHSPIFHDFPLCLFICLFVTFLHLLTHFLFIFYLFMI